MSWRLMRAFTLLPAIFFCLISTNISAGPAQDLFREHKKAIYQIRVIELSSGNKSSIGSGFQINPDGMIATNYHVISDVVHKPEKYRLEYINHEGKKGELSIKNIDIVHDLALVKHQDKYSESIHLADDLLNKGEGIFSIGNPLDLGMIVIAGAYSGLIENSFYERILFSGSLNPGMSGGPALDITGKVTGINVATSGNQISFLVPVKYLHALLADTEQLSDSFDFNGLISRQLLQDQTARFDLLLASDWPRDTLGKTTIIGEIARFTRCWGDTSNDKDSLYSVTWSRCSSNDSIYISNSFNTGKLDYEFYLFSTNELNPVRFFARYQNAFGPIYSANKAGKEDVTNFQCHQDFVDNENVPAEEAKNKGISAWDTLFCSRSYNNYPGIYDVLFINAYLGENDQGLITHFSLTGVSRENSMAFLRRFMEHVRWN